MGSYLFIYSDFSIGGIQTQILEQCRCIQVQGREAKVLLLSRVYDKDLLRELHKVAQVAFIDDLFYCSSFNRILGPKGLLFSFLFPTKSKFKLNFLDNTSFCHVANLTGFLCASIMVTRNMLPNTLVSFGIYHPSEISTVTKDSYFTKTLINSLKALPFKNVIATGTDAQNRVSKLYKVDKSLIKLLKMGVPLHDVFINKNRGKVFQVLSIGRLADFKSYNVQFLNALATLVNEGYDVTYEIVGDGPLLPKIESRVKELGLEKRVSLTGNIKYSELDKKIDSADCFLGSGTTLIMSAARSCPCLIGLDSHHKATSYGLIQNTTGQDIQENDLPYQLVSMASVIKSLIDCDSDGYNYVRMASFKRAQEFSLKKSFANFDDFHEDMDKFKGLSILSIMATYFSLIISIVKSIILKESKVSKIYE